MLCYFQVYSKVIHLYIYMYLFFFFQILFPFRLLQNIEQSSLCYVVTSLKFHHSTVCLTYVPWSPPLLDQNPRLWGKCLEPPPSLRESDWSEGLILMEVLDAFLVQGWEK